LGNQKEMWMRAKGGFEECGENQRLLWNNFPRTHKRSTTEYKLSAASSKEAAENEIEFVVQKWVECSLKRRRGVRCFWGIVRKADWVLS